MHFMIILLTLSLGAINVKLLEDASNVVTTLVKPVFLKIMKVKFWHDNLHLRTLNITFIFISINMEVFFVTGCKLDFLKVRPSVHRNEKFNYLVQLGVVVAPLLIKNLKFWGFRCASKTSSSIDILPLTLLTKYLKNSFYAMD